MRPTVIKLLAFALLAALLAACAKAPYTGRSQFIIVGSEQEARLGAQAASQIKAEEPVVTGTPEAERVERVGKRVAQAVGKSDYDWEFNYIDKDVKNAFALPGGKVFVYKGILDLADNDDQLATVMSHEIAHVTARHGAERLSQQLAVQLGAQAAGVALSFDSSPLVQNAVLTAYGVGTQVGVMLPYSRAHESEADHIGLIYMTKAGYDPDQAVAFWRKMAEDEKQGTPPEWLSTHPADETRIQEIKEALPEIKAAYGH